jgi:hypothetical protein
LINFYPATAGESTDTHQFQPSDSTFKIPREPFKKRVRILNPVAYLQKDSNSQQTAESAVCWNSFFKDMPLDLKTHV